MLLTLRIYIVYVLHRDKKPKMEVFHLIEKFIAGSLWKLDLVYFKFK